MRLRKLKHGTQKTEFAPAPIVMEKFPPIIDSRDERIAKLESALSAAGSQISMLQDGCLGPPPMWIQDVLNAG